MHHCMTDVLSKVFVQSGVPTIGYYRGSDDLGQWIPLSILSFGTRLGSPLKLFRMQVGLLYSLDPRSACT